MANREKNQIEPGMPLHLLKRRFQKRFMVGQIHDLLPLLDGAIEATLTCAPIRESSYLPPRPFVPPSEEPTNPEARLERRLYYQWAGADCSPAVCWHRMVCYQVNLPNTRENSDWGEIDLLAVSSLGMPIVVELKAGDSSETPAAMLVQAAAYGIALRKAWSRLRLEWQVEICRRFPAMPSCLRDALDACQLVCAAPDEYWREWIGKRPKGRAVKEGSGEALRELQEALGKRGLVSSFVTVGPENNRPYTPCVIDIRGMR